MTVSPGGARTELVGRHGDGWKVRLVAPAERGRANEALGDYLARVLGVRREDVAIRSGLRSRRKILEVGGVTAEELERRLESAEPR